MANICCNLLEIVTDTPEELQEIVAFLRSDQVNGEGLHDAISFGKVIPQPPNIYLDSVSSKDKEMCQKHGLVTWDDWNTSHWGTKWDAYDVVENPKYLDDIMDSREDNYWAVRFSTAWGPPSPVIEALASKFPKAKIRHSKVTECDSNASIRLFYKDKDTILMSNDEPWVAITVAALTNQGTYVPLVSDMLADNLDCDDEDTDDDE